MKARDVLLRYAEIGARAFSHGSSGKAFVAGADHAGNGGDGAANQNESDGEMISGD